MKIPYGVTLVLIQSEMRRFLGPTKTEYSEWDIAQLELLTRLCLTGALIDQNEDAFALACRLMMQYSNWRSGCDESRHLRYTLETFLNSLFTPISVADTEPLDLPVTLNANQQQPQKDEDALHSDCESENKTETEETNKQYTVGPVEPAEGETFIVNDSASYRDEAAQKRSMRCVAATEENLKGVGKCFRCAADSFCDNMRCHAEGRKGGKEVFFQEVEKCE